jgi:hypothetical protein
MMSYPHNDIEIFIRDRPVNFLWEIPLSRRLKEKREGALSAALACLWLT